MKEITVQELYKKMNAGEKFQLIDVREPDEVEISNIGGLHIPMSEILDQVEKIETDVPVIIHCRSGARSSAVIKALETHHHFSNLYNLSGGIMAWSQEIDPSITVY